MTVRISKQPLWKQGENIKQERGLALVDDFSSLTGVEQLSVLLPGIELTPKQAQFMNTNAFLQVITGGDKSGKTFTAVCKALTLSYINSGFKGLFVHPTADGIEITVMPVFEEIFDKYNINYSVKNLATKKIIKIFFGRGRTGIIVIGSGDKPRSLKGPNFAFAVIDEPFIMKKDIFQVVVSRLAANAVKRCLILCGTPEPIYMVWGKEYLKKKFVDTDKLFVITISARDNPYNSPDYIANLEALYDAKMRKARIDGELVNLSGETVYDFSFEKNVISRDEALRLCFDIENSDKNLILTFDFNYNPMTACLWYQCNDDYIQMKEFKVSHSYTKELVQLVISQLKTEGYLIQYGDDRYSTAFYNSLIVTGDASGRGHKSTSEYTDFEIIERELESAGVFYEFAVPAKNPEVRDRINFVNTRLELGAVKFSEECEESINDRESVQWKKGAVKFSIDKSNDELTHLSEAGDYGLWNTRNLTKSISGTNDYRTATRER
jgi:PBSX family phage terminase large subunit